MAKVAFVAEAKERLLRMNKQKIAFMLPDAYGWCKLIAGRLTRQTITTEEFYDLAEECIADHEKSIRRCSLRGIARNYFYDKIPEVAAVVFAEFPEFVREVEQVSAEKKQFSREALMGEPSIITA
ncbi:MAG: hypothetical protein PHC97_01700 [Patescibacteria group bacterium]|nr:hypothetical protein [Patescibacteria group bacterium]